MSRALQGPQSGRQHGPMRALSLLATLLLATPAFAADQDAPIATSNGTVAPGGTSSTAAQIEDFVRTSPAAGSQAASLAEEPRRVHGEVSLGVGSDGYRSVAAEAVIPVGKTGSVGIAVERSRGPAVLHPCDLANGPYPSGCRLRPGL